MTTDLNLSGLYADLSTATASTINELRQSFQIQKMLEKDARGGTRYIEIIKNHFGVTSPDSRMQRSEFLGSFSTRINITPVQQTAPTVDGAGAAGTPQGNLSGFGVGAKSGRGFVKSFTEHSVILGLVTVRCDLTYQEGLDRMWTRQTRYDYYWPSFAHLGEQAVLTGEIYTVGGAGDDVVFGYQERYAEYRYKNSQITGQFRSNHATSLDLWHLSQSFLDDLGAAPTLNDTFITPTETSLDRAVAVSAEPHFKFDSFTEIKHARPMPVYAIPGKIDHF